ncbi:DUF2142 domain-containing protein [Thermophilibacter provencensis]|uniref:DUF2142 domain-containing protein n=1 Tax=Thermophilibacter provencensis TaxID=1852386 RepID=A0ABT7V198_9ACTN|nr:DUF2142 domain-containing protein [Thermophilibacter provencensis]MDM8270382.1 DUF2142 domain-containing protein [Thermophilibacter provencensis]
MIENAPARSGRHLDAGALGPTFQGPALPRPAQPHCVFLILWLIAATTIAIMVPLGAGFDETMHIARVSQLAHGVILPQEVSYDDIDPSAAAQPPTDEYALYGGSEDAALQELAKAGNVSFQTADLANDPYAFPWWTDARFSGAGEVGYADITWAFPNTAINSPLAYLPYVVGFLASSLLTQSPVIIGIVTRLCGILFFGAAIALAIRLAPAGKWAIAAVALTPLSLLDHSFVTADMMTFAAATLFVVGVMRLATRPSPSRADWGLVAASGCVVALAKLTYLPLGLILFLVPALRKDLRDRSTWSRIALVCIAALSLFALWYIQIKDVNTGAMWSDAVDPAAQGAFVLSNPLRYLYLFVCQLFSTDCFALEAPFTVMYPSWLTVLVYVAALYADSRSLSALCTPSLGRGRVVVSGLLAGVWLLVGFLISLALYLQFTPVGSLEVAGVQSRYYLPLIVPALGALMVALVPGGRPREEGPSRADVGTAVLLVVMVLLTLVGTFIKMY